MALWVKENHDYSEDWNQRFERWLNTWGFSRKNQLSALTQKKTLYYTIHRVKSDTLILSLTKTNWESKKQETNKKNNMERSVSFKNTKNNDEIALTFKRDSWKDPAKTLYMKHHFIPGDTDSEKVSCKCYILSGIESWELYVCWRQDIHVWIYENFPTKQARDNLIAQLVEGQAKVIYGNCIREILENTQYDRATRQSDASYVIHQTSDRYQKKKHEDAMETIRNYVFGSGTLGNFTYTIQKWYLRKYKFQPGQAMKIKDYWICLKEIIEN